MREVAANEALKIQASTTPKNNARPSFFFLSGMGKGGGLFGLENVPTLETAASSIYAGRVPTFAAFSKEAIRKDIAGQNLAGKPCGIAQISNGKITYKWHGFHAFNRN